MYMYSLSLSLPVDFLLPDRAMMVKSCSLFMTDFKYGENFYLCITEAAKDLILNVSHFPNEVYKIYLISIIQCIGNNILVSTDEHYLMCVYTNAHRGRNEMKVGGAKPPCPLVPTPLHFTAHN